MYSYVIFLCYASQFQDRLLNWTADEIDNILLNGDKLYRTSWLQRPLDDERYDYLCYDNVLNEINIYNSKGNCLGFF